MSLISKNDIIIYAKELGFDLIKFTPNLKLENEIKNFNQWLDLKYNADMDWLHNYKNLREDPKNILEDCKSIIVFAISYNFGIHHIDNKDFGKISRYAFGKDYHKVIKKKLKKLDLFIKSKSNQLNTRYFTDSGPVMEREWAIRAGIGARGKNSLILNKELGSYFFLSVMLINEKFEYDDPISDLCGNCTKCLKACPTGAIEKEYIVNSNKCISYWTIESKENEIPEIISENQNNWLFGCDICQEVCPYNNHKNKLSNEFDFLPKGETSLNLIDLMNIKEKTFELKYQNSPLKRRKFNGIKKNAFSLIKNY